MDIFISISSSFIGASIFLFFLTYLRPSVSISKEISFIEKNNNKDYSIKLINLGIRNLINMKIEVDLMESINVPDGFILSSKHIKIKKSNIMILSKFDKKDLEAKYAFRIIILDDLDKLWEDNSNQYLRIKIFAQDEISNFGKVFTQEYRAKRVSIKNGEFRFGNTLEII